MATKKFVNKVSDVVSESLSGLSSVYPHLDYHASKRVVLAHNWRNRGHKVAIVCGGGSGHEPFAAGFVGTGMITAAVAGDVFAAPPPNHILHALNCVSRNDKAGVLVVIPNYTGDRLNFGLAIEEAKQAGLEIAAVVVADDCSIPTEEQGRVGKRGLVGLLFVNKIAGALAEREKPLAEVTAIAQTVADNIATYGVGFNPCSMPGQGRMFEIPENEIEFGLGVHGEAGYKRCEWSNAAEIVDFVIEQIIKTLGLDEGSAVALIVNNFGGTSQLEQGIVVHEVVKKLKSKGVEAVRIYSGTLMSSLDSAGLHVSVLRLPEKHKSLIVECLDDETDAPSWPGRAYTLPFQQSGVDVPDVHKTVTLMGRKLDDRQTDLMKSCLANACRKIIEKEENINCLDRGCGDGDCGSTHKKLADGILGSLNVLKTSHPASLLIELGWIAEELMGGTSGAIYSLMFTAAAAELADCKADEKWNCAWARVLERGIAGVMKYSQALPGDRTMLDALIPACKALEENSSRPLVEAVGKVAEAAWSGCEATKNMQPKTGRASYVKQAEFLTAVDAGSFAVATWIDAIAVTIANFQ